MVGQLRMIAALAALVLSSIPAAQAQPNASTPAVRDPNQKVCEVQQQVGTRLGGKKVCLTRAEWAARKAADRESVEMMQRIGAMPCVEAPSASSGFATC